MAAAPSHRKENLALVVRYQQGDRESAEELLRANAGLVGAAVRCYAPRARSLEPDDLFIAGQLGLLTAAAKFDVSRGLAFSTYASHWIRQAVSRAIEATDAMIHVPTWCRRSDAALPVCDRSHDAPAAEGEEERRLGDLLAAPADPAAEAMARLELREWLAVLSPREREVLLARAEGVALRALADRFGCGREKVRRLEERARERLRAHLAERPQSVG